jgi:hypothetical protein
MESIVNSLIRNIAIEIKMKKVLKKFLIAIFVFLGEISYKECLTFNDMSGPAMINTFNDINKLVQARKLRV